MDHYMKIDKKETKESRLFSTFIRLTLLIGGYYLVFFVGSLIFINQEYRIPQDIGYINLNMYEKYASENDISFDMEINVSRTFFSYDVDENEYDLIFADENIFNVGTMNISFISNDDNFYSLEFIEGEPFSNSDEVVISEKISLELFQSLDSINKNIEINEISYKIVGIIKDYDDIDDCIIMQNDNINYFVALPHAVIQAKILVDDDLHLKLYEKGGYDLINNTITRNSQGRTKEYFSIFSIFSLAIGLFTNAKMKKNDDIEKQTKEESIRRYQELGFSLSLVKSLVLTTMFMLYMIIVYIVILSYEFTFLVSGLMVIDFFMGFPYIFLIYLIPIIWNVFTELKIKRITQI
ncbi:hypothetical protein BK010_09735 [Tenericutes bacterium MO-XQ]|nr:hypothetical protein BK010_09735 [Tenericutes bacterium MO-XQ]